MMKFFATFLLFALVVAAISAQPVAEETLAIAGDVNDNTAQLLELDAQGHENTGDRLARHFGGGRGYGHGYGRGHGHGGFGHGHGGGFGGGYGGGYGGGFGGGYGGGYGGGFGRGHRGGFFG